MKVIIFFIVLLAFASLVGCSESRSGNRVVDKPGTVKRLVRGWWISTISFDTVQLRTVEVHEVDTMYRVGDSYNRGQFNYIILK